MKKIGLGAVIALVIILAVLLIDKGGFVQKKLSYQGTLQDTNITLDQNEYAIFANDSVLQIGKESVTCFDVTSSLNKKILWTEVCYTKYPEVVQNGNNICVFDKQGYNGMVYSPQGKKYELKVSLPILSIAINKNGATAVLQKSNSENDTKSVITIFKEDGTKLIDRISYEENGGVPICVAISDSNDTFSASYLDVSNNNILSKVIFFKIDGKELKDNLFSSFEFSNTVVTNLKYLDDENVLCVGDDKLIKINLFSEKCTEKEIEDRISDVTLSFDNRLVLICSKNTNSLSSDAMYAEFYTTGLKKVKEQVIYNTVSQISTNKSLISVGNGSEYYIYSKSGIARCKTSFSQDVKNILLSNKTNVVYVSTSKGLDVYRLQTGSFMNN